MEKNEVDKLLDRFHAGLTTPEEEIDIEVFIHDKGLIKNDVPNFKTELNNFKFTHRKPFIEKKKVIFFLNISVAATIMIVLGTSIFFLKPTKQVQTFNINNDIKPGSDKATLTLSNGTKINLSDAKVGFLSNQSGIQVTKAADGTVIYKPIETVNYKSSNEINTITTPNGGQYKIILPDGTKVWLNAASSLSYRTSLKENGGERKVNISGEAYFEVAKDKKHPFIVITDKQRIEVLGTHFNVSAYNDERLVKTTLIEGSVKVAANKTNSNGTKGVILKPNQESILSSNGIKVNNVEAIDAIAWKNGEFAFTAENLGSIMQKIARWYNVDVVFTDQSMGVKVFSGTISRFDQVNKVLQLLERTKEVKFQIEGRRITVMSP